jgi:hypothetical protein
MNPFGSTSYATTYAATSISSGDISYDASTGRVTFARGGTFLIVTDILVLVSGATGIVIKVKVNGSDRYISSPLITIDVQDPRSWTCHGMLDVADGDYLEVTIDSSTSELAAIQNGTSLVLLRAMGDYGSLLYTARSDAVDPAGGEHALFDSDNAGTVTGIRKGVTLAASTGLMTPATTRKFLMFSTPQLVVGGNGEVNHRLFANGSAIDGLPGQFRTSSDPQEMSYGFLKELTGGQTTSVRLNGTDTVRCEEGTSFSIFDISDEGVDPSAYLSFTVDSDSADLAGGTDACFDGLAKTDQVTAVGITYTSSGGTFVVANSGKYFILWTLMLGTVDAGVRTLSVINGTKDTTVYTHEPWYIGANNGPMEKTVCLIVDAEAGDSFRFIITDGEAKIDAGTAITMFKVDDARFRQEEADALIADDYTINTFAIDTLGKQHDRAGSKQVPFVLGIPGPMSLRGRGFASTDEPHFVAPGDKKN